jgi:hypothetical protein
MEGEAKTRIEKMSETIYIRETREFLTSDGTIVKEEDLTPAELKEMKEDCSMCNRLFGNNADTAQIMKG